MPRKPRSRGPLFEGRLKEGALVHVTLKPEYFFYSDFDADNVLVRDSGLIKKLPKKECLGRNTVLFYTHSYTDDSGQRVVAGGIPARGMGSSMEKPLKVVGISEKQVASYAVYQKGRTYDLTSQEAPSR